LIAYVVGDRRAAANELDSVVALYPNAADALAAAYWSGRAWKALGDTAAASRRWRDLLRKEGASYYSVKSAERLGVPLLADSSMRNEYPSVPEVNAAVKRIVLRRDIGLDADMRFEHEAL
jgi:hypothetical protein